MVGLSSARTGSSGRTGLGQEGAMPDCSRTLPGGPQGPRARIYCIVEAAEESGSTPLSPTVCHALDRMLKHCLEMNAWPVEELLPCSTSLRCMCGTTCHSVAKQNQPPPVESRWGCLSALPSHATTRRGPYSERHLPSRVH